MTSNSQPAASVRPVPVPAGTYRISPDLSTIEFRTRHLFGLGRVRGSFAIRDGWIRVDAVPRRAVATVTVAAASFHTGNPNRDAAVVGPQLLDASRHPDITVAAETAVGATSTSILDGTLTVRGAGHPLRLTVSSHRFDEGWLSLDIVADVDRYAYQITAAKGLAGRWLHLDVHLAAELESPDRGRV